METKNKEVKEAKKDTKIEDKNSKEGLGQKVEKV